MAGTAVIEPLENDEEVALKGVIIGRTRVDARKDVTPEIERQVQDLLDRGVIEPSESPRAANIVLVKKKDCSKRLCVDNRDLNEVTIRDAYPIPRIDETLDALGSAKWFSTLDLSSGYWKVALDPDAQEKTSFIVRNGLYKWKVMPFGLTNAPATFERLMEKVMKGLQWEILLIYLDDVSVYGRTVEEEIEPLNVTLSRLRGAHLKTKAQQVSFVLQGGQEKVTAYFSRELNEAERNYCVARQELLALITGLKQFRQYLPLSNGSFTSVTQKGNWPDGLNRSPSMTFTSNAYQAGTTLMRMDCLARNVSSVEDRRGRRYWNPEHSTCTSFAGAVIPIEQDYSQRTWDVQLPFATSAYRSRPNETTSESPNMMMLGREARLPIDLTTITVGDEDEEEPEDYAAALRRRMTRPGQEQVPPITTADATTNHHQIAK
ncbi:uncharacterized protein [Diadema setosum]|uniref:uncharacterized protein n=1 Tax=Diadema setosum TaxID=31175 RepID=UPI003B3AA614